VAGRDRCLPAGRRINGSTIRRVALTGVSGFIGSVIARALVRNGHTVTGLVRETSRRDHVEDVVDRFVVGSQDDRSAWSGLLEDAEAVIHNSVDWAPLKAVPVDLAAHLERNVVASIELLHRAAPRPFVFMSSVAVHHDMRPRWAGQIDEDHPLRPSSLYGAAKAAVEAHLWAEHFGNGRHVAAIRPCAVYGIDPDLSRSIGHPIIETVRRGERYERSGGGKFVHVDDVAAATVAALEKPEAAGRAFNLADCYARWGDLALMAADLLDVAPDVDLSSPERPRNTFTKDAARELGVPLDRGHDGIRTHLRRLIEAMDDTAAG